MAKGKIEVTVSVKRNGGTPKTYQLTENGESRKGTYKVFSPAKDCPDLPEFAKVYVNATLKK